MRIHRMVGFTLYDVGTMGKTFTLDISPTHHFGAGRSIKVELVQKRSVVGEGYTRDEDEQFEKIWLLNLTDREERVRGGHYTSERLTQRQRCELIRLEETRHGKCYFCHKEGHVVSICPDAIKATSDRLNNMKLVRTRTLTRDELGMSDDTLQLLESVDFDDSDDSDGHSSDDVDIISDSDIESFSPDVRTDYKMVERLYNLIREDILAIGYIHSKIKDDGKQKETVASQFTEWNIPALAPEEDWRFQFDSIRELRPLQHKFITATTNALIAGQTNNNETNDDLKRCADTIFLLTDTNGGKTTALVVSAIEAKLKCGVTTIIMLPQRNVVEDVVRGLLSRLTSKDAKHRKQLSMKGKLRWQKIMKSSDKSTNSVLFGGDIIIPKVGSTTSDNTIENDDDNLSKEDRDDDLFAWVRDDYINDKMSTQTIRWCVFMGSDGITELREVMKDREWLSKVDILVGTVDAFYGNYDRIPGNFMDRLGMVLLDEVDMLRDDFGVNTKYLLKMLGIRRSLQNKSQLVVGLSTATCNEPESVARLLTTRDGKSIEVIRPDSVSEYRSIYQRYTESGCQSSAGLPTINELIDIIKTNLESRGNLIFFYSRKDDHLEQITRLLNRQNYPSGASVISFHDTKRIVLDVESKLRKLRGHDRLVFSYTGDHSNILRWIRGMNAGGKTMIATSAAKVGQNIQNTVAAFKELEVDAHAMRQYLGRSGRDRWGMNFVVCDDPGVLNKSDTKNFTSNVLRNPGEFLLGRGQIFRLPIESPLLFYKNAYVFLERVENTNEANQTSFKWKTFFRESMFIPTLLTHEVEEALNSKSTISQFKDLCLTKFTDLTSLQPHLADKMIFRARHFPHTVKITTGKKSKVIGNVSLMDAFKHYFPGSTNRSIIEPHQKLWQWNNATLCDVGLNNRRSMSIHDLYKINVIERDITENDAYTYGILKSKNDCLLFDKKKSLGVKQYGNGNFMSELLDGDRIEHFHGYSSESLSGELHSIRRSVPDINFWFTDSQYRHPTMCWIAKFKELPRSWVTEAFHHFTKEFIETRLGVTSACYESECMSESISNERHNIIIRVFERERGRSCGVCVMMFDHAVLKQYSRFMKDKREKLY